MAKIFWLDDNPEILKQIKKFEPKYPQLSVQKLLEQIDFAFDYEMGKELLAAKEFDLYVLDADFPRRLTEQRRAYLRQGLECLAQGWDHPLEMQYPQAMIDDDRFIDFYKEHQAKLSPQKVVVLSISRAAIRHAFLSNLPYYSKGVITDEKRIKEQLRSTSSIPDFLKNKIDQWEGGDLEQFINRYLLS